jgi:hypothetical protein
MKTPNPPIEWPHVTVDGEDLEVRFTMRVMYRASKAGLDLAKLGVDPAGLANRADLFALCVAHNFEAKGLPTPSGEEWLERIGTISGTAPANTAMFQAYALSKLMPAATPPATAPAPARETLN